MLGRDLPVEIDAEAATALDQLRTQRADESRTQLAWEMRVTIRASLAAAEKALTENDFATADLQLGVADSSGADTIELKKRLKGAKETKGHEWLATAWQAVKADRPDEALEAQRAAEALGVHDDQLEDAVQKTPTQMRRRLEHEQSKRDHEKLAHDEALRAIDREKQVESERTAREKAAESYRDAFHQAAKAIEPIGFFTSLVASGHPTKCDRIIRDIRIFSDRQTGAKLKRVKGLLQSAQRCLHQQTDLYFEGRDLTSIGSNLLQELTNQISRPAPDGSPSAERARDAFRALPALLLRASRWQRMKTECDTEADKTTADFEAEKRIP